MSRIIVYILLFCVLMVAAPLAAQDDDMPFDGDLIAVPLVCDTGDEQIFLVSSDGDTVIHIEGESSLMPQWSRHGDTLHYVAYESGFWSIFIQNSLHSRYSVQMMGGDTTWLGQFRTPFIWSPDGSLFAYLIGDQLVVMTSAGMSVALTDSVHPTRSLPTWSPDSTRLALPVRMVRSTY